MKCKYCGTEMGKGIEVCPKCGRIHKNPFGDKKKIGFIGAIALAIVLSVCGIVFAVSGSNSEMEVKVIDEAAGEYMLINAPTDLTLDVSLNTETSNIKVYDIYGEPASSPVEVSGKTAVISAPEGGYIKGEIYTVDVSNFGNFSNKEFDGAKKLTFVVQKKDTVNIEYKVDVKELSDKKAELENEKIVLKGSYNDGDIIVVDADGNGVQETYKLQNVVVNENITEASYTVPKTDEVYEEIEVFYYDDIDFSKAEVDEEAVGDMLEESGIIEIFTEEAYAAKDVLYKAEFDGKKNFKIEIKDPKDEKRTLTISFGIEDKALLKVNKKTIYFDNTITVMSGAELKIKGDKDGSTEKSIRDAIENYVAKESEDLSESDYKKAIIPVTVPVAGPVAVYIDLGASANFAVSTEFKASIDAEVSFTQGIAYDLKKFKVKKVYADIDGGINAELMAKGELDAYAGLYLEAGAEIPSLVSAGIRAEGGPYVDAKGCFIIKTDLKDIDADGYYKVELGLRFKAKATIDPIFVDEKTFKLGEADKALFEKGNYLKLEDSGIQDEYQKLSGEIYIGDITATYHNKITDKNIKKEISEYKLYIDGDKTKVNNGYIVKNLNKGTYEFKLEWSYGGQNFTAEKDIKIIEFDPWGYFENINLMGLTFDELERRYGTLEHSGDGDGGIMYNISGMTNHVVFSIDDTYDSSADTLFHDAQCVAMSGFASDMYGISEPIDIDQLMSAINPDEPYHYDPDFGAVYTSKNNYSLTFYTDTGYCYRDTFCFINGYNNIKGR